MINLDLDADQVILSCSEDELRELAADLDALANKWKPRNANLAMICNSVAIMADDLIQTKIAAAVHETRELRDLFEKE